MLFSRGFTTSSATSISIVSTNSINEFFEVSSIFNSSNIDVISFDRGIFNLGYYPKGDKTITTQGDEVIATLEKALACLNPNGRIIVVCYPGFEVGLKESLMVEGYLSGLPSKEYDVYSFKVLNRRSAPYIIGIDKH
ncbi:MAG: class I SAM-dependent methyltransferase [Erysipelotrichales bacterium]|nr:class I SAM-dependent methyltransferase [Erysipelotrichales bacterium]